MCVRPSLLSRGHFPDKPGSSNGVQLINALAYWPYRDTENHLLPYSLTSFAVSLFMVVNGIGSDQNSDKTVF